MGETAVEWYQLGREICSVLQHVFGDSQAFGTVDLFGCMSTVGLLLEGFNGHGLGHDFGLLELTPRSKIGAVQFRPLYSMSEIRFI
jgi:hypothetical protein